VIVKEGSPGAGHAGVGRVLAYVGKVNLELPEVVAHPNVLKVGRKENAVVFGLQGVAELGEELLLEVEELGIVHVSGGLAADAVKNLGDLEDHLGYDSRRGGRHLHLACVVLQPIEEGVQLWKEVAAKEQRLPDILPSTSVQGCEQVKEEMMREWRGKANRPSSVQFRILKISVPRFAEGWRLVCSNT